MKKTEIYSINRRKAFIRRLFEFLYKPFIFSHRGDTAFIQIPLLNAPLVISRLVNGKIEGEYNEFTDSIEFFLFNLEGDIEGIIRQFIPLDAHERLHRLITEEIGMKDFIKGEEDIIERMCHHGR